MVTTMSDFVEPPPAASSDPNSPSVFSTSCAIMTFIWGAVALFAVAILGPVFGIHINPYTSIHWILGIAVAIWAVVFVLQVTFAQRAAARRQDEASVSLETLEGP